MLSAYNTPSQAQQCTFTFCGCQHISYPIHDQNQTESQIQISAIVFVYIFFIIAMVMGSVNLGMKWFIYKDYYPLKQKSPILCLMILFSICVQLILYPILYTTNYFTSMFNQTSTKFTYRAVNVGLQFSVYALYFLRCLRISYAHKTHSSRQRSLAFKVFEKQWLMALCVMIVVLLRAIFVKMEQYLLNVQNIFSVNFYDFAFSYQLAGALQVFAFKNQGFFIMRYLVTNFIWQILLIYCLYLQKHINYRYSMRKQLQILLGTMQIINIIYIINIVAIDSDKIILKQMCNTAIATYFPISQFSKFVFLVTALIVTIIVPLRRKRVYHVLLPGGPQFGLAKSMRNFLLEKQFLTIFHRYLEYLNEEEGVEYYTKLLKFWQQTFLLKVGKVQQSEVSEEDRLTNIKSLITEVQDNFFIQQRQLISTLKGTILNLEDEESLSNELSDIKKIKFKESISSKVNQLEQISLEKLNRIYHQKYCYTESYQQLKKILQIYTRINVNLVMLKLALIVETDNDFYQDS